MSKKVCILLVILFIGVISITTGVYAVTESMSKSAEVTSYETDNSSDKTETYLFHDDILSPEMIFQGNIPKHI